MRIVLVLFLLSCAPDDMIEDPGTTNRKPQGPETSTDKNGTRLRRYVNVMTGSDGTRVEQTIGTGFRDTKLNIDCNYAMAANGMSYCLPYAPLTVSVYMDSKCMMAPIEAVPVAVTTDCDGKMTPGPAPEWVSIAAKGCAGTLQPIELYRKPVLRLLPMVYMLSGTTCYAYPLNAGRHYAIDAPGEKHLLADFVQLTRTNELQ